MQIAMEYRKSRPVHKIQRYLALFAIACVLALSGCAQAPASSSADAKSGSASESAAWNPSKGELIRLDEDGYLKFSMPWNLSVSYGITMREDTSAPINPKRMRYPYKFTQTLNFSGNLTISEGWNINFSSGYDFNYKKLSMTTASLSRDLHCFSMSASMVIFPYTSYNFTFSCKAGTLADALRWKKQSSYSGNIQWYQ